ncbi:MAG: SDR family oxidoreductase [Novosphingobium sp.]
MLKDKNIVVTGGFGTLGRAVVAKLEREGARVAVIDLAPVPERWSGAAIGGVDLADPAQAERALAGEAFAGGLDGLVNVAGGFVWEPVEGGEVSSWDRMHRMNLGTALAMSRAALPLLKRSGGAIVNIGAAASARAAAGMGAYTASKSAVARLTEAMADELKDAGVRVNAVLPTTLDTPVNRADMPDVDPARWVKPEALAEVIAFLLGDGAGAVTGALLPVTGRS